MAVTRIVIVVIGLLAGPVAYSQVGHNTKLVNPNLASADELAAVDGMNASVAKAVIAARPVLSMQALAGILNPVGADRLGTVFGGLFLPIDLNTASRGEIMLIPGMSERMAYMFEAHRPYASLEQFRRAIGEYVDANELARLEQYVFVPMDLNSATTDAFMTIPGVTHRMAQEFEAHRPYTSLEQFRREIGKYVDASELARLERYITVVE